MYPAAGAATSVFYSPESLLAAVEFGGDTLSHDAGLYKFTGSTYYIILNESSELWEIRRLSDNSLVQEQACLIQSGVTDQLEDEYLISGGPGSLGFPFDEETVLATRQSRCIWSGLSSCGKPWMLQYRVPPIELTWDHHFALIVWHHLSPDTCAEDYEATAGTAETGSDPTNAGWYSTGERSFTVTIP